MASQGQAGETAIGLYVAALAVVCMGLIAVVAQPDLPFTPVRGSISDAVYSRVWAPQGWSFFTKSPRDPEVFVFQQGGAGTWRAIDRTPYGKVANVFGLSRRARAQGVELGLLLEGIPPAAWLSCDQGRRSCFDATSALTFAPVRNRSPIPSICGRILLVSQRPLPWAWRESNEEMPASRLSLEVTCSKP
jgi:antimicrobial peptide system SdpA family protein